MRVGRLNKGWLLDTNEKFIGISLGADHCAEHQWGITGIERMLGIELCEAGLPSHTVGKIREGCLKYYEDGDLCLLICTSPWKLHDRDSKLQKFAEAAFQDEWPFYRYGMAPEYERTPKRHQKKQTLDPKWEYSSGWSGGGGFMVVAHIKFADRLKELYDAAFKQDLAVWVGGTGGNPFDRGGLILAIVSKVSEEHAETMRASEQARRDIDQALEDTGLPALLKAAGKNWYALSPTYLSEEQMKEKGTSYNIEMFLNPHEQQANNFGWFTVEELKLWAVDAGPIPKRPEDEAARKAAYERLKQLEAELLANADPNNRTAG